MKKVCKVCEFSTWEDDGICIPCGQKTLDAWINDYGTLAAENERLRDVIRKGEDGDCDLMDRNDLLTTNLQITVAALVDILHVDYKMHPECECVEVHDNIAKEALAKILEAK